MRTTVNAYFRAWHRTTVMLPVGDPLRELIRAELCRRLDRFHETKRPESKERKAA